MKKSMILCAMLVALSVSFAFTGCGSKNNDSKNETETRSESGSKSESKSENAGNTCAYNCPRTGFGFDLPENVKLTKGFLHMNDIGDLDYDSGVMMGWPVYRDMTEEEYNALTAETIGQAHVGEVFDIICVKDVNSEEEAKEKLQATIEEMMGQITENDRESVRAFKMIHQEDGYIWMSKPAKRAEDIREENKEEYNAFYDASEEIISNMTFYPPQTWKGAEEGTAISFETVDLNGNPVKSENLFAQNKVTMINIWATTCGPCINEMAELEEMNKEFKEKGGAIVGLVDDVWVDNMKYLDEAKSIIEATGVTYTNLCAWDGYQNALEAVGTPTTYFVNSHGEVIGDAILGAHPKKYKEKMEQYLSEAE